jgi:ribosome-associated protein
MLEERKAMDILLLDVQSVTILADYFVLCTATSERHLGALAGDLSKQLKADVGRPMGIEGEPESGWQLVDYGDVVVHLFLAETRVFYDLEGLWREAQTVVHIH